MGIGYLCPVRVKANLSFADAYGHDPASVRKLEGNDIFAAHRETGVIRVPQLEYRHRVAVSLLQMLGSYDLAEVPFASAVVCRKSIEENAGGTRIPEALKTTPDAARMNVMVVDSGEQRLDHRRTRIGRFHQQVNGKRRPRLAPTLWWRGRRSACQPESVKVVSRHPAHGATVKVNGERTRRSGRSPILNGLAHEST
jgi:hypothetical protein